ncbi:hypothetical protein FOA52_004464 [Chlamydomonas sp. UWO 241]|nr:hypothetical protein FOA52_004464 [Chlamydomonas sp. UWO 241]
MRPSRGGAPMRPMQPLTTQLRQSVVTAAVTGGQAEGGQGGNKSSFRGVSFNKVRSTWEVRLKDPETKRKKYIGSYASDENAARAYDCAAVKMHGSDATLNFPGELINAAPVSLGDECKQRKTSSFIGVSFHKTSSAWRVQLWDPVTKSKQWMGRYVSRGGRSEGVRLRGCEAAWPRH